jgi:hypothetical protein
VTRSASAGDSIAACLLLEADFTVGGNEHADDLAAGSRHQGFQQARRFDPERLRGLHPDALGIAIVVIFM